MEQGSSAWALVSKGRAMKFNVARTRIGDDQVRVRNILESDECAAEGFFSQQQAQMLISTLAATPTMLMCGTKAFEKLSMRWNGKCWVIELEATAKGTL